MGYQDPFREYPWRILGYANAFARPFKDSIPKPMYQLSLGLMHTFFLTNAVDYSSKVDSKSQLTSAIDCYTWHCAASWVGPALVMDGVRKLVTRATPNKVLPIVAMYGALAVTGPAMDAVMNWYFYGFWKAGHKDRPRLTL